MEIVDKFNNKRQPLNKTSERYEKINGEYKLSMHVWIQNDKGEFLIQKRSPLKKVFPNYWSITGGGVDSGESTLNTVFRECKEELGITVEEKNLELILSIKRKFDFVDIYLLKHNIELKDIILQKEEVSDVKWVNMNEIKNMMNNNEFAPNISAYVEFLQKILNYECF